jgi:hypothetical protein
MKEEAERASTPAPRTWADCRFEERLVPEFTLVAGEDRGGLGGNHP